MELVEKRKILTDTGKRRSLILKFCIFATGLAGIVAEYVLSTLASYLLGNPVIQWTLVISLMLFAMGVGSRLSKYILKNLLDAFILTEFAISFLCSISAAASYFSSIYTSNVSLIIYSFSFTIGLLIGLEIPMVTRMNNYYEELRTNIATVMEKDYFGALLGGIFFAFFALPYLGLTYTPIVLGLINFSVASVLLFKFRDSVSFKKIIYTNFLFVLISMILLFIYIKPIILYGEQRKYKDTIIYEKQTRYQKIVITRWKNNYWLFINGNEQFSSFDEERYHEPLVHPAMAFLREKSRVLILGGGDGLALREVLKYPEVKEVVLVDIDPEMTRLAREHPVLVELNRESLSDSRVEVVNDDAERYLSKSEDFYNLILVDLPDPNTVELSMLYSIEFFMLSKRHLSPWGVLVTQATSPIYSKKAFLSIMKTMREAGFTVLPYHNQIPTLGEWGWVLGVDSRYYSPSELKERIQNLDFETVPTRFINREAMISMVNFGKGAFDMEEEIEINSKFNPVLYRYYRESLWDIY